MARKNPPPPPPTQPTIEPDEGISLLRIQIARANELLAKRSREDELRNWQSTTEQILSDALGPEHDLAFGARVAGAQRQVLMGGEDLDAMWRDRVQRQAKAIEPCIEHLERQTARLRPTNAAGTHDTAQVCGKGHLVNDAMRSSPAYNAKFCAKCGTETISECPACHQPIQGLKLGGAFRVHIPGPPAYCHNCGAAFPWTEASRRALSQLLAMSGASEADQAALRDSVPALVADSPETPVAILTWKKFLAGAGKQLAEGFKHTLLDLATEAAKRQIFGP